MSVVALGIISFVASNPSTSHRNGIIQDLKGGNWQGFKFRSII